MSDLELPAGPFRELRGDYVEHQGQRLDPGEYLDFFEPLGSSLSRSRDGVGGPFVYRFTASGGRVISALGWVVSAASRRYGAWSLWGMWTDRRLPELALPLFWPQLADASQTAEMVSRANRVAERLFNRKQWSGLGAEIGRMRIHDDDFREVLAAELSRLYAGAPPSRQPLEIELSPSMLDLLPWIYLLGPVDPFEAQLQPSRFNGDGYQYILNDADMPRREVEIRDDVEELVEAATDSVIKGLKKANELRGARKGRAVSDARVPVAWARPQEDAMTPRKVPVAKKALPSDRWISLVTPLYQLAVVALLVWIALEVRDLRKTIQAPPATVALTTAMTTTGTPATTSASPAEEVETDEARVQRLSKMLVENPPRPIHVSRTAIVDRKSLANAAVEVFLRRNGCFNTAETVDGKLSAAEQRAMRGCPALRSEQLVNSHGDVDQARAIAWLDSVL